MARQSHEIIFYTSETEPILFLYPSTPHQLAIARELSGSLFGDGTLLSYPKTVSHFFIYGQNGLVKLLTPYDGCSIWNIQEKNRN